MKKILFTLSITALLLASCDKVDNAYPIGLSSSNLDWDLYPGGDSTDYANNNLWPSFTANPNTNRNILIEDFTGHKCTFCPAAATEAESIEHANPGRVYIATLHTSPNGIGPFQSVEAPKFTHDFTCPEGLETGVYFGDDWPSSSFIGNPKGTISRINDGTGQVTLGPGNWNSATTTALTANDLKVNLQASSNYFPSTQGYFLHTEIDVLDGALTNELDIVVYVIEDSIIKPQKMPDNSVNEDYVHRDVMVDCIDGRSFGRELDEDHKDTNGKYYFNYSYKLPVVYNPDNMHVLIYVRDAVTEEIYQVIEQHFQ